MFGGLTRQISLGVWGGVKVTLTPFSALCFAGLAVFAALSGNLFFGLDIGAAFVAGASVGLAFFVSEYAHQRGHALAARRVGYPMIGMHFNSIFALSLYPADEPSLSPDIHIRRALGGFWVNVLIGLLLAPAAINLWPQGGGLAWATALTAGWNFFVLGLGALAPIDIPGVFTIDGGTLLHYWREKQRAK